MWTKFAGIVAYALLANVCVAQQTAAPLTLSPHQEEKLRAFVASENHTSSAVAGSFKVSVGSEVPRSVTLYTFERDLEMNQYRYVVISGKTVIVDPTTRKIIRLVD
jgi:hypothetical protein